jgi:hypothetical protein
MYEAYLEKYPEGEFAVIARVRLADLDDTARNSRAPNTEEPDGHG